MAGINCVSLGEFTVVDFISHHLWLSLPFQLVNNNQHAYPTISVDSAAQKFHGKATRPFPCPSIQGRKVSSCKTSGLLLIHHLCDWNSLNLLLEAIIKSETIH